MYFLLGISLTLAFLLIVNMTAAGVAACIWRLISGRIEAWSADACARIIFALRVGPVAAALVFVFAFVVPAYLLHEPDNSGEVVSGKLAVIAGLSSVAALFALYRVFQTWRVTRQLAERQDNAVPIALEGIHVPVFRIVHPFPVLAVVGVIRPRLFIAEQVLGTLNSQELRAAVAHERGHLRSHDNLKRTILQVCRDLVLLPLGTNLDGAWTKQVESAADEYAANTGRSRALDLASALVRLARIAPLQSAFAGSRLFDANCADVTERVRRLIQFAENNALTTRRSQTKVPGFWFWPTSMAGLIMILFAEQRILLTTHEAIEHFVWIIQ